MYGNESLPSIVLRYGCKAPQENVDIVADQARLAHRYRNKLVEIELDRRARVEQAVRAYDPALPDLEADIDEIAEELAGLRSEIRRQNSQQHSKRAEGADRERAADLRASLKAKRAERKERRAVAFADGSLRATLDKIDAASRAQIKQARADSGLYWGNYLIVEQAMSKAGKGRPPRFRRWDGSAHLAVQFQGGLSVDGAFGGRDRRMCIEPLVEETGWTMAHLRIASDGRDPVMTSFRVKVHRAIPRDAAIKWAHLVCTPIGPRREWSLQLVVSRADGWQKDDLAQTGTVGVDLGWRLLPKDGGLRVAYAVGSDGREEELVLPLDDVGRWQKADDLRSIRDRHFNTCRDRLADWLAEYRDTLPHWLRERAPSIQQWRSQARLAALCLAWREQRFKGDEWVFDELAWGDRPDHVGGLEHWRRHDKHLWCWESSQRAKAVAWRRDLYRCFVARLSRRYHTAHIEDCNWKDISRHLPAEEDTDDTAARLYRHVAAPGTLAQMIEQRFAATLRVNPAYTTMVCHQCGSREEFDAARHLRHQCQSCGAAWDQDFNAARNLLASGQVVAETPGSLDVA